MIKATQNSVTMHRRRFLTLLALTASGATLSACGVRSTPVAEGSGSVLVIGAGIAGIATAHALCAGKRPASVLLIDPRAPMSHTSAQAVICLRHAAAT